MATKKSQEEKEHKALRQVEPNDPCKKKTVNLSTKNLDLLKIKQPEIEQLKELHDVMVKCPRTYGCALEYHMKRRGVSEEEIEASDIISKTALRAYMDEKVQRPKIENIIAICLYIGLEPLCTLDLISLCGLRLKTLKLDDLMMFQSIFKNKAEDALETKEFAIFLRKKDVLKIIDL